LEEFDLDLGGNKMGLWATDVYVKTVNVDLIQRAIEEVFCIDGYSIIPKPSRHECLLCDERLVNDDLSPRIFWGIVILPGERGWSIINCNPLNLLSE
jgi:hypothetical protein